MTATAAYLTPPAIARLLGVKASKIVRWCNSGEISAVNVAADRAGRPRWKISRESFEQFLATRGNRKPMKVTRRRKSAPLVEEFFP